MDCQKAQECLITDYVDNQIESKKRAVLEQHLDCCSACSCYLRRIKEETIDPFVRVGQEAPDRFLWIKIKEAIQEEVVQECQLQERRVFDLWERIKWVLFTPRPAFALGAFLTIVFMLGTMTHLFLGASVVRINGQDQMQYLSSLIEDPLTSNNSNEPQTPIEKVFL